MMFRKYSSGTQEGRVLWFKSCRSTVSLGSHNGLSFTPEMRKQAYRNYFVVGDPRTSPLSLKPCWPSAYSSTYPFTVASSLETVDFKESHSWTLSQSNSGFGTVWKSRPWT